MIFHTRDRMPNVMRAALVAVGTATDESVGRLWVPASTSGTGSPSSKDKSGLKLVPVDKERATSDATDRESKSLPDSNDARSKSNYVKRSGMGMGRRFSKSGASWRRFTTSTATTCVE